MRVAHIITRMIVGGAQENTLFTCRDLIDHFADDVLLITGPALGPEGDLLTTEGTGKVPVKIVPSLRRELNPWRDALAYLELRRILREFRPDVVHTHSAKGGILGRRAAWSLGVPAIIHTVHGAPFHRYQSAVARRFYRACEWWGARHCHRLISVADAMTDLLVTAGVASAEKFCTIYSGMDIDPYVNAGRHRLVMRSGLGIDQHEVVVGKIARFFPLKGHDDFFDIAIPLALRHPQLKFLLVGDGILRQKFVALVRNAGVERQFLFTGLVPPKDIPRYLSAMDILLHTSLREGLPRALPQALLAGKPVVSYDIDGAREVCVQGETGFLIPPRRLNALAAALGLLIHDLELRSRLANEGQRRCRERFDHVKMTELIRAEYERVLAEQNRAKKS